MEFHKRFELLDLVHDDGVKTYEAFDVQNATPVWVHMFAGSEAEVLQQLAALPQNARESILAQGMGESILDGNGQGHYVVTRRLPETNLRAWLKNAAGELTTAAPASMPAASLATAKPGRKQGTSNAGETGKFSNMFDSSRTGSALASPDAPKQSGHFSRMFQTSSAPPPPPPSVVAAQRKAAHEQGEFTRMFQPAKPVEAAAVKLPEEPVHDDVLNMVPLTSADSPVVEAIAVHLPDIEPSTANSVASELPTLENTAVGSIEIEAELATQSPVADTSDLQSEMESETAVSDTENSGHLDLAVPLAPSISSSLEAAIESEASLVKKAEVSSILNVVQAQPLEEPAAVPEIHAVAGISESALAPIQRAGGIDSTELQLFAKRNDTESAAELEEWLLKPAPPPRSNLALFLGLSAVLVLAIVIVMLVGARI